MSTWGVSLGSWATGVDGWTVDDDNPPSGFGASSGRVSDQPRGTLPGSAAGVDVPEAQSCTVGVLCAAVDEADAVARAEELRAVWAADAAGDETISVTRGGVARVYFGRPNGAVVDETLLPLGFVAGLCSWRGLDPYGYGGQVDVTSASFPLVVAGTKTTERVVVTIHGNGGTPQIDGVTLAETFAMNKVLSSGQTRVVDVRARTVTTGGGASAMGDVALISAWPRLAPGPNTWTVTGCASIDITYRPAYA